MTCIAVDREKRTIASDSANTDSSGFQWSTNKIEKLPDGRIFLGSGHNFTITQCRLWAISKFKDDVPDAIYDLMTGEDSGEYSFTCLILDPKTNTLIMVDDEMVPMEVGGRFLAVGSGAAYALGALHFGATVEEAVAVAVQYDQCCSGAIVGATY